MSTVKIHSTTDVDREACSGWLDSAHAW